MTESLAGQTLTYSAIGATASRNETPHGFRYLERTARIGSGEERWQFACREVMTWALQRRSGFRVEPESLTTADAAWLVIPVIGSWAIRSPVRVVYTVDEPARRGFAYGTLPGHPESGEEAFLVERHADDSVWVTIRAFSRPSRWYWWLVYPVLRIFQERYTRRYLRVLAVSPAS